MSIRISRGIAPGQRAQAAQLYWGAFGGKLGRVLGPERKAMRYVERVLAPDHALAAVDPAGQVLGVIGFRTRAGAFVGGTRSDLVAIYGRFGAAWRATCLSLIAEDLPQGVLLVDGLAVDQARRGEGIGAALVRALCAEAAARGYAEVRLDVVGENIRARALYDRLGFVVLRRSDRWLTRVMFDFRSALVMARRL